ncbi:MAG: pyridoxal phosphate-dependent class II aminotransferase [Prevotellaceae bacterium]|nr:pyridoxal phosphate-dependent class II aminotransferase [Candidatus Minthosoma equi]
MVFGHGDDTYKYKDIWANFSSNVYGGFDHEDLFCHLAEGLDAAANYPEPSPLTLEKELAGILSLTPEQVMVTNGATEAIYLIAQTFRRSKTAILQPTFSEYADACRLHEHQMCSIYDLEQLPERAQMIWLCNPNNPTGITIDKEVLTECISSHPDVLFIIDASYDPYTKKAVITPHEAAEMPNVLMIHSMTKEFAIPGLRLGYLVGNENILTKVRLQRMPWSVNTVAIDAGHYLLRNSDQYELPLDFLIGERERMTKLLEATGCIEVWPSDTHMMLCRLRMGKAEALKNYLAEKHGILIRDASNFEGLDSSYFRIAVQTKEKNEELIERIAEWIIE